jgi:hypothetical protein
MSDVTTTEILELLNELWGEYYEHHNEDYDGYQELRAKYEDLVGRLKGEITYGCHCDLESMDEGFEPDGCVIDEGNYHECIYAKEGMRKEDCEYWRKIQKTR